MTQNKNSLTKWRYSCLTLQSRIL